MPAHTRPNPVAVFLAPVVMVTMLALLVAGPALVS